MKGYRDIIQYVCTPIYIRCRTIPNCVRSPNICNGVKKCMNKWNTTNDCIHLKRRLHTMNNDVRVVGQRLSPASFIGLFFTAFNFFLFFFISFKNLKKKICKKSFCFPHIFNFVRWKAKKKSPQISLNFIIFLCFIII